MSRSLSVADEAWAAIGGGVTARLEITGEGDLPSAFPVTKLAVGAVGVAALALGELTGARRVQVDRRLASFWFGLSLKPEWAAAPLWDPIAGDYPTGDEGWIRLHTNAPHHRAAAEGVLGSGGDRAAVAAAVARWSADELETAVVAAGGCAAAMRSLVDWDDHPQGMAVATEPLVHWSPTSAAPWAWAPTAGRPLKGLKVLDLTRVLAGPTATRFLAGFGAEVLRIDPPGWDEPGVVPEVTLGKRCARLDLTATADRAVFERLLSEADVLVHGYRPGALEGLGYGAEARRRIAPGLVDVTLDAYGWTGPWAGRRGFDSLMQMSTGIADAGMAWKGADKPVPLPVQALDHATGYLMAATVLRGVVERLQTGRGLEGRLSLARTARLLVDCGEGDRIRPMVPPADADYDPAPELTAWGTGRRMKPPVRIDGAAMAWDRPAAPLGSSPPAWGG